MKRWKTIISMRDNKRRKSSAQSSTRCSSVPAAAASNSSLDASGLVATSIVGAATREPRRRSRRPCERPQPPRQDGLRSQKIVCTARRPERTPKSYLVSPNQAAQARVLEEVRALAEEAPAEEEEAAAGSPQRLLSLRLRSGHEVGTIRSQ